MYQRQQLVCLNTVVYNDSSAILNAYSRQNGRIALQVPAGNSREARRRRALTMPLNMVECLVDVRQGRSIFTMRDVAPTRVPSPAVEGNPVKMAVSIFLADLLGSLLRDSQPDEPLFDFLEEALEAFANMRKGIGNFHLAFIYRLGHFLGVAPDTGSWRRGSVFDMREGSFRPSAPLHNHYIPPAESRVIIALSKMTWTNLHRFRLSRDTRNTILDLQLRYLSMHLGVSGNLTSLDVVRTLF